MNERVAKRDIIVKFKKMIKIIEKHYMSHGVLVKLNPPLVLREYKRFIFSFEIKAGTKIEMIFKCSPDIKTALNLPLFEPFRVGGTICLAVSEKNIIQNSLIQMLTSPGFKKSKASLPIALGYDMLGRMVFDDLAEMLHVMYAGSTNSGKSSGLINLVLSLILKQSVEKVNLILFDVGASTLGVFDGIPHLSCPVVKDIRKGIYVIKMLVEEMERRIKLDSTELQEQPVIICIIDEYVSFIEGIHNKNQTNEVVNEVSNILRRGRHAKIQMVLSAQDPTVKNMKVDLNNITTRMAFACAKYQNSITILGEGGAEKLMGKGTVLYKSQRNPDPIYLQGAYVLPEKIEQLVDCVKSAAGNSVNKFWIPELELSELSVVAVNDEEYVLNADNDMKEFADIIMWTLKRSNVSASKIMKQFSIGNRAYGIMNKMSAMGIVSDKCAKQPRKVLPQFVEDLSSEIVCFLEQNGYNMDHIKNAFKAREECVRAAPVAPYIPPQ